MKNAPPPKDKTPHERFLELGKRLLAVPKDEVSALEKEWKRRKTRRKRR